MVFVYPSYAKMTSWRRLNCLWFSK